MYVVEKFCKKSMIGMKNMRKLVRINVNEMSCWYPTYLHTLEHQQLILIDSMKKKNVVEERKHSHLNY